jgi:hypothetical protein
MVVRGMARRRVAPLRQATPRDATFMLSGCARKAPIAREGGEVSRRGEG